MGSLPCSGLRLPIPKARALGWVISKAVGQLPVSGTESSFQTGCLIFTAINISLIITSLHFLWRLKLKLTGFSRYNFDIITVDTFGSKPGGEQGGGSLHKSYESEPSKCPMMSHYPPLLLRRKCPTLQMPEISACSHPAPNSQRVLMNTSIFLFCSMTAISDINASCLRLLNLLHVGQLGARGRGGKTGLERAKLGGCQSGTDPSSISNRLQKLTPATALRASVSPSVI